VPVSDRSPLRPFAVLVAAYTMSTAGSFLNLVAVNLYVFHLTGSALQTGLLMAARIAAGFLAGPVAGWVVLRFERRLVLLASDIAQGLAMVSLLLTLSAFLLERMTALSVVALLHGALVVAVVVFLVLHRVRRQVADRSADLALESIEK